nr:ribonuclease H-like domain-containing protein [Tanacetum cinerariifolium]
MSSQNFKKQSVSNNNSVRKSSSSGFTDKQMTTLISLIKDNKVEKNMQANMSENKVIVTFVENRCYFLNQDLNLKNVLGIGEQCEGLYYYSDKDPVLNVLKDSLNFDKKDNTICCEICQRAKQTREPFPICDHKSKSLGDLFHLDLWGPYKVTSSMGFRVASDLNKGKSDSSNSSESDSNINTVDFPVDSETDSSNDYVASQNEEVPHSKNMFFLRVIWIKIQVHLKVFKMLEGRKAIESKWIYKIKFRSSGEIDIYTARLVAQGFRKKERIDYEETFSHVVKMVTVRCLLNTDVSMSWHVFQLDVNNAFVYGDLE